MDGFIPDTGASFCIPSLLKSDDSRDRPPTSLPSVSTVDEAELGVDVDVEVDVEVAECVVLPPSPPRAGNSSTESRCTLGCGGGRTGLFTGI